MRRFLALVLIAVIGLMPMSGMASSSPASGDTHEMPCHGPQPDESAAGSCGDMKGCCAVFLAPAVVTSSVVIGAQRVFMAVSPASGFVPDQTDPPPVVL